MENLLPAIPAKRYFTIGEVGELCAVKPHVLRYWEQEFTQLRPMKRRGNRRYYQHHEVLMIRRIRELLYDQGFTISGARNRLQELGELPGGSRVDSEPRSEEFQATDDAVHTVPENGLEPPLLFRYSPGHAWLDFRSELLEIREMLCTPD
ncbi:MAG: MerR family transcriptional regulator [Betaproteobacteria bacterium]